MTSSTSKLIVIFLSSVRKFSDTESKRSDRNSEIKNGDIAPISNDHTYVFTTVKKHEFVVVAQEDSTHFFFDWCEETIGAKVRVKDTKVVKEIEIPEKVTSRGHEYTQDWISVSSLILPIEKLEESKAKFSDIVEF